MSTFKSKITDIVMGSMLIALSIIAKWLEYPEIALRKSTEGHMKEHDDAATRKRKRKEAFRESKSQHEFVIDKVHRRRSTDIKD